MLPSTLALREQLGTRELRVSLTGPPQADGAMPRLVRVLGRHGIQATVHERRDTLESTVRAWLDSVAADDSAPVLDVSSASGGTATRAVLAMAREATRPYRVCWFNEANNEVHVSNGSAPHAHLVDIGSKRSVRSPITPSDFMAIFGLERATDDPYCGVPHEQLIPIASQILQVALERADEYREFRRVLAVARKGPNCLVPMSTVPAAMHPVVKALETIAGWISVAHEDVVFCGTRSTLSVFFLSGGWLEVLVGEAVRRALPEHHVQLNCGTSWGRQRRAEAELDVAFVYNNALYLLSCKNDHLTERFFPHLDRFRALTAEFGESRTRPVLLSTAELEARHIRRCDAYEIGQISGTALLTLIDRSLKDEPERLLEGLLTVSRGAPRAGIV